jgi:anti-sigma regulatory factor (Ser/Thr protein kinase)
VSSVLEHRAADAGDHVVQFYESDAELVAGAGSYLSDAAEAGAVGIVIATEAHREAFETRLRDAGVDVAAARDEGTLVLLDAAATLARFMRDGCVDRDAFFEVIGGVVHAAAATGRPVRAYGEMVALLWEAGDVMAAIDLETLWNELGGEVPFSLYCAYRSESVSGHQHADALERVCHLHSAVVPVPPVETTWQFAAEPTAPADARRLLVDALQGTVHDDDLLDDAQLVVAELAANAVVHARLPFSVSIRSDDSTLRILVRDRSQVVPVVRDDVPKRLSGRGLRLVTSLASRWGVDVGPNGKVVWAEFAR